MIPLERKFQWDLSFIILVEIKIKISELNQLFEFLKKLFIDRSN